MDKYEYRVKTEQMLEHMERKRYKKAMEIADTIDWRRVKNPAMLNSVSEIYEFNGEYQKSRDVLFVAYDRAPNSRKTIYRLGTLALRLNDVDEASDCYEEFVKLAPKDPNQYILKYKILKARRAPLSEQIDALEEFKKAEYIEKWAYELACLYDQTGMTAECLEECDDLILWFSEGKYVYKAMELKMKYKPLTPLQQEKYNSQKKAYEHPVVESEEAEEQQEEEAKAVEEAPENAVAESPEKDTDKGKDKEAETSILREEPKEVSTEDIAAKALAAVAETEEVPLTAEKKEAEKSEEEPAEKPHKRSGLRQSVKGATLAEALKKGMAVANGENPESKALNKSDEDLRVTGQMKIDDILQAWEAKQKDNAEAIEIQKKKDEEVLAQKKLEAEKRREEEARRIEEQQRAAEEARRIAEQKAAEEARRAAARRAEEERLLAEQRAEEERRRAIEEAEAEERRLEQEAAEKAKAEAEARRKQEEEETQEIEEALEEVEAEEDEFEEAELEVNRRVEVIQKIAPAVKERLLVLVLCKLVVDILKLNRPRIARICDAADAVRVHALIGNGFLRGMRRFLTVILFPDFGTNQLLFLAGKLFALLLFLDLGNVLLKRALPFQCVVQIFTLIRALFRAQERSSEEMLQHDFQRFAVLLVHAQQDKRHHDQHHDERRDA